MVFQLDYVVVLTNALREKREARIYAELLAMLPDTATVEEIKAAVAAKLSELPADNGTTLGE